MRGIRSFLLLLLVAVPLGWYAYRDSQRPPGDDGPKKEKVFAVESDGIEEITVKADTGDRTTLRKTGTEWQIVQPEQTKPDAAEASGLATSLASLEVQSVVDENATDLKEYGLDQPRVEVSFKAGGKEYALHIGGKTPPGSDVYARRANENKVFLIPSYIETTFNRKPFDLRDKSVLQVERDKVEGVEISNATGTMRLARVSGEWQMVAPVAARADFTAVESLVGRVAGLQMKSIETAGADDPKKRGLDKPVATVKLSAGSSQAVLTVGGEAAEGSVYARDASRAAIITIDSSIVDELKKDSGEYRQKDLFDARSFNAGRVEIARGGQTFVFEKVKAKNKDGQEEEKWRQTSPQARDLDQAKVDALLNAITGSRASSFAAPGAKTPTGTSELTVAIKFDEGRKDDRVTFSRSGTDAYATRAGDAAPAKIDGTTIDAIVKALEDLGRG